MKRIIFLCLLAVGLSSSVMAQEGSQTVSQYAYNQLGAVGDLTVVFNVHCTDASGAGVVVNGSQTVLSVGEGFTFTCDIPDGYTVVKKEFYVYSHTGSFGATFDVSVGGLVPNTNPNVKHGWALRALPGTYVALGYLYML